MRSKCKARRVAKADTDELVPEDGDHVIGHMTDNEQSDEELPLPEIQHGAEEPNNVSKSVLSLLEATDIPPSDFVMSSTMYGLSSMSRTTPLMSPTVQEHVPRKVIASSSSNLIERSAPSKSFLKQKGTAEANNKSIEDIMKVPFGRNLASWITKDAVSRLTNQKLATETNPDQSLPSSHPSLTLTSTAVDEFSVRQSGSLTGVWTNVKLEAGRLIGPIVEQKSGEDKETESTKPYIKLMKFIQQSDNTETSNLMAVHIQNQLYYRAIREIQEGEEMLLYAKDRLYQDQELQGIYKNKEESDCLPCGECGEVFKNQPSLLRHQTYSCNNSRAANDYMKQNSQSDDDLKSHLDGSQSPEMETTPFQEDGEFKCEECPRSFGLKSNLARHQIVHESGRRFSCEHCERHFTDPSNLQRHIRSQHHGARCHTCTDCGKNFATSSGLKQHQHIHSSVKPFQCEVCLKAYTQFSNLCRHKRMHADCRQQIKCNDCGQAFSTITSLSKHKRFCEGALRSGMRLGSFGADPKLSAGAGLINTSQSTPFSPAMMMGLYGGRPPFPFYPPSLSGLPMFPSGHPLAALTSLSPSNMRSSFPLTPEKLQLSPAGKFEKRAPDGSEGGSEVMSGSDLDNIPSDSESEKSAHSNKSHSSQPNTHTLKVPVALPRPTPYYPHSLPSPKYDFSPKANVTVKSSPSPTTVPMFAKVEQLSVPFDLSSKPNKHEHVTPKSSPKPKEESSGEQPLDLSCSTTKMITPPEAPRKTHIFGDVKTPVFPENTTTKLHYAYPQYPTPLMMEQVMRMAENKEKSPENAATISPYMSYPRFPFSSPTQYPVGVNPFGLVSRESPKSAGSLSSLSPQTKTFPDFSRSPTMSVYSTPNKLKDRYSCKFCGKIFPRSANLTRHLRTHTGEQPYKCKYCERSFSISSNLQRHVRNIHNKEKPFRCPLCDRCFGQQTNLDRHLKKHETDGLNVVDSPERDNDLEDKDESYFSEIRNFIGKATEGGAGDINQNSLTVEDMKRKMINYQQENVDDEDIDEEIDPVSDDFDDKLSEKSVGNLEIDDVETGEPASKKARIPEPIVMNTYQNNEDPMPLCKKAGPGFELKRGFSPVLCL